MKTSRFANVGDFGKHETPISISRWSPKWYFGKSFHTLAAPGEMVLAAKAGKIDREDYEYFYKENVLSQLDPFVVLQTLKSVAEHPILLCYEDLTIPGEWCHRRMVADWFVESGAIDEVPEWKPRPKVKSNKLVF